jgi:hypothetical protein
LAKDRYGGLAVAQLVDVAFNPRSCGNEGVGGDVGGPSVASFEERVMGLHPTRELATQAPASGENEADTCFGCAGLPWLGTPFQQQKPACFACLAGDVRDAKGFWKSVGGNVDAQWTVVSMSHFLPSQRLLPEKRFLTWPNLVGECIPLHAA